MGVVENSQNRYETAISFNVGPCLKFCLSRHGPDPFGSHVGEIPLRGGVNIDGHMRIRHEQDAMQELVAKHIILISSLFQCSFDPSLVYGSLILDIEHCPEWRGTLGDGRTLHVHWFSSIFGQY